MDFGSGAVSLKKGDSVSLKKGSKSLEEVMVGLGWKTADSGDDFDLDASAFVINKINRVINDKEFVFFGNPNNPNCSVVYGGDDLKGGDGNEDCEQIEINLTELPPEAEKVAISATIYEAKEKHQNFGLVSNAYIRVVDKKTGKELLRYDLAEDFSTETGVVIGEIYRDGSDWKFRATGVGYDGGLYEICKKYNVNVG